MVNIVENATIQNTMLTGFYAINQKYTDEAAQGIQIDPHKDSCHRLYAEMLEHFTWDKQQYCWKYHERSRTCIGRLVFISPSAGDLFFLQLLLTQVCGPTSSEDLRTVDGNLLSWREACAALGLLENDNEWDLCL